jgi:tetratricopeptide (TPR) repeat protein
MLIKKEPRTIDEIKEKLTECRTLYNQLALLEGLISRDLDILAKKFVYGKLVELYTAKEMFDKAAKAMRGKATLNTLYREVVEDYTKAGELYVKASLLENAEDMFNRALAEANTQQAATIRLTMKNVIFSHAKDLENKHRTSAAVKFYEKVLRIPNLSEVEKEEIKGKLRGTYKSLGMFRELKMLDGNNSDRTPQRVI